MKLYKAEPVGDLPVPSAEFSVSLPFPSESDGDGEPLTDKDVEALFVSQACFIAEKLQKALPRGTWDRLVAEMVRRHATMLIIPAQLFPTDVDVQAPVQVKS